MDGLDTLWLKLALPFVTPLLPDQRIYVVYMASALVLAFVVYEWLRRSRPDGAPASFFAFCFPKRIYGHPSALVDYAYFFVNKASFAILFAPLIVGSTLVSDWTMEGLAAVWSTAATGRDAGLGAGILFTLFVVLATDGAIYLGHYLQHKVPLLWEFHKVHHSAEVMTPITVYRMHPVDDLLVGSLVGIATGLVHGTFGFFYEGGAAEVTVLKINLILFLFYVLGYNLRHSHIWLPYPVWLSHFLVSPAQHQIHHSSEPRHFDKNIGLIFAFWDWAAGTLYVPREKEEFELGLYGGEHRDFNSVWKLYSLPFKNAAALLFGDTRSKA